MAPPSIDTSRARRQPHHGDLPPTPSDLMNMTTKNGGGGGRVAPAAPSSTTTTAATSSNYHSNTTTPSHYPAVGLHVPPSPPATDIDDNESETRHTTPAVTTPTHPGSLSPVQSPSVTSPPYWQQQYSHSSLPYPTPSSQHPHAQHPSVFSPTSTCSSLFPEALPGDDENHGYGHGGGGGGGGHARTTSIDSLSALGGFITLRDNESSGADDARNSACWARAVEVTDHVVVNGTAVGHIGAFAVWNVRVETLSGSYMNIRKRYSEFDEFRSRLIRTFPSFEAAVPELPPKSVISKFRPSFLEKRRAGLQYFLNCILLNPEFSGSPVLKEFLFS